MEHMFFDIFHSRPQVRALWPMSGLMAAMRPMSTDA
jgi:hypothetical protein